MDQSDLRRGAIGLALLLLLTNGPLRQGVERRIERDLARRVTVLPGGKIDVRVRPAGPFGMLVGRLRRVEVHGREIASDGLPLASEPGRRGGGRMGTVRIVLDRSVISRLPVERLEAEIPGVRFNYPGALVGPLRLTGAGVGPGSAVVTADGLAAYLPHKYPFLRDLDLTLRDGFGEVRGDVALLGPPVRLEAVGRVGASDGRYVLFLEPTVTLGGRPIPDSLRDTLLNAFSPVLDLDRDLRLRGAFQIRTVLADRDLLIVTGDVTLPPADPAAPTERKSDD